ncbi:MAG TPA: histidine kinase, partial [Chitinophagaceae bacterium]|nr:histidine kinase [Chitinophagaceae bacterium]
MAKNFLIQVGFWIIFFLFWYQIVYVYVDSTGNRLLFTFLDVLLIMATFYFVYALAVPKLLLKKKKLLFVVALLGSIAISGLLLILLLKTILHSNLFRIHFTMSWNFTDLYNNRFFIALFGAVAGLAVKLSLEWTRARKRIREVEHEKTRAELNYLKNQVNPHFLFNALNTIYFQLDESTENARNSLLKFSDILRYQLYNCNDEYVPVMNEIEYLDNYIRIQQLRKEANSTIDFSFDTNWQEKIAPLLLIPFVENAFKYVSPQGKIDITIERNSNGLHFHCSNTFEASTPGNGLGIANAK